MPWSDHGGPIYIVSTNENIIDDLKKSIDEDEGCCTYYQKIEVICNMDIILNPYKEITQFSETMEV
jgi:hypothetical protein